MLVGKLCQRQALTTPPGLRILPGLGRAWRCCASAKTSPGAAAQTLAASLPGAPSESSGGSPKVYRERLLDGEEEVLTEAEKKEKDTLLKELRRRLSGPLADEDGNVPTGKDRPIAIEVDGPSHFYANTKRYTAYTKLKHRLLTRMGYKVLHVPYFEWRRLRGAREREQYMRDKLLEEPSEWLDPEDEAYYNQAPGDGEEEDEEEEFSAGTPAARPPPSTPPPPPVQKQARGARRDDGPSSPAPSTPSPPTTPPPPPRPARSAPRVQAESKPPPGVPAPFAPPQHPRQSAPAEAAEGAARSAPLPPPPPPAAKPAPFPVEEDARESKQSAAPPPVPPPPPRAAAQVPGGIPDFPPQPKWSR